MDKTAILADLRNQFGKKTLLTPEDLADVIDQSPGAQAVARHRGQFDIPLTPRGRRVLVSIYDLADWLSRDGSAPAAPVAPPQIESVPVTKGGKPRRASLGPLLLMVRARLDFDMRLFAALEAKTFNAVTKKIDKPRPGRRA
jgi:hypothetical protein